MNNGIGKASENEPTYTKIANTGSYYDGSRSAAVTLSQDVKHGLIIGSCADNGSSSPILSISATKGTVTDLGGQNSYLNTGFYNYVHLYTLVDAPKGTKVTITGSFIYTMAVFKID